MYTQEERAFVCVASVFCCCFSVLIVTQRFSHQKFGSRNDKIGCLLFIRKTSHNDEKSLFVVRKVQMFYYLIIIMSFVITSSAHGRRRKKKRNNKKWLSYHEK